MSDYETGYRHGMMDMHTHAMMLLSVVQPRVVDYAIANATVDYLRRQLVAKYNTLTGETE